MNKILFYCSWGGFGHVARAYAVIKELPKNGKYFVATPEKWPFQKPNKNFKYINLPTPQSRNRFEGEKVGRNDACPCGSGKKYKKCHGK